MGLKRKAAQATFDREAPALQQRIDQRLGCILNLQGRVRNLQEKNERDQARVRKLQSDLEADAEIFLVSWTSLTPESW